MLATCLVGVAFIMLSPDTPPLDFLSFGGTDQAAPLPPPPAARAISPARQNRVASGEPTASGPEPDQDASLREPVAPLSPPAPALAASPALAPAVSPASGAVASDHEWLGADEAEKHAPVEGSSLLKPHQDTPPPEAVAAPPPPAPAVAVSPTPAPAASTGSEAVAEAKRRIAALESDKEALTAEVSRLERDREAPTQTNSIPSPSLAAPAKQPESGAGSAAAADAEKRIAALESEKDALAAEVSRLERDRESSEKANSGPAAATAIPAGGSDPQPSAALASLPEGMPARVLIRYPRGNADARRQAESLADALKKQGVEVADLRESDGAVGTGVSFFYARDAAIAQRIGGLIGVTPTRRPQMRDGLMARPGAIELSFSGDSHLAVVNTPRKESVQ
jgi:hypothetical protein